MPPSPSVSEPNGSTTPPKRGAASGRIAVAQALSPEAIDFSIISGFDPPIGR